MISKYDQVKPLLELFKAQSNSLNMYLITNYVLILREFVLMANDFPIPYNINRKR